MLRRLLALALATLLLTACGMDVRDELPPSPDTSESSSTPQPASSTPRPATPTLPPAPTIPIATLVAPTREPTPVGTPMGTTGVLDPQDEGTDYDEECLAGARSGDGSGHTRLQGPDAALLEPPQPYQPIGFQRDEELQERLEDVLGDRRDSYAFFVKDLASGRGATHDGERIFNAASLFKLFVMYEVFHQQYVGLLEWDREIVVTPYYDAFGLSPRVTTLCEVLTIAGAMDAMLSLSDNTAAVLLQDLAGAANINRAIEALGLKDSGLFTQGLPVTANDVALLLEAIARGEAVSPDASADMLQLMSRERFDNGLVRGLPADAVVAHKTGNWPDATHDAGVVYTQSGAYVFVVLSDEGYETEVIQALSTAAYQHFAAGLQ